MSCHRFLDLTKAYDGANDSHHVAVAELIKFAGKVNHAAFAKLKCIVEDTGTIGDVAWNALEEHRKEHRCDKAASKSSSRAVSGAQLRVAQAAIVA